MCIIERGSPSPPPRRREISRPQPISRQSSRRSERPGRPLNRPPVDSFIANTSNTYGQSYTSSGRVVTGFADPYTDPPSARPGGPRPGPADREPEPRQPFLSRSDSSGRRSERSGPNGPRPPPTDREIQERGRRPERSQSHRYPPTAYETRSPSGSGRTRPQSYADDLLRTRNERANSQSRSRSRSNTRDNGEGSSRRTTFGDVNARRPVVTATERVRPQSHAGEIHFGAVDWDSRDPGHGYRTPYAESTHSDYERDLVKGYRVY